MKKLILSILALLGFATSCSADKSIKSLPPHDFSLAIQQDTAAVVIDVRRPAEFSAGHLQGAQLLDVSNARTFTAGLEQLDSKKHYYVYCRSGRRSHEAAQKMKQRGLQVVNLKGGILQWQQEGLPIAQ